MLCTLKIYRARTKVILLNILAYTGKILRTINYPFSRPNKTNVRSVQVIVKLTKTTKIKLLGRYSHHTRRKPSKITTFWVPVLKQSAIFNKSRFSNYNLTFCVLPTRECFCFIWHGALSGRGSSIIATCVYKILEEYNKKSICRGCSGKKNNFMPSMLLNALEKFLSSEKISDRHFENNHGQSEGNAAHSAISIAISTAEDIYHLSQLHPIIRSARRQQPYHVILLKYDDFLDFKSLSNEHRILLVRKTEKRYNIKWPEVMQIMLTKNLQRLCF